MARASNERRTEAPVRHLNWGMGAERPAQMNPAGPQPCITCGRHALLVNPGGDPQHKTCAEREAFGDG